MFKNITNKVKVDAYSLPTLCLFLLLSFLFFHTLKGHNEFVQRLLSPKAIRQLCFSSEMERLELLLNFSPMVRVQLEHTLFLGGVRVLAETTH